MALNDLSYDILTALQSKLEAVAAYETFMDDCKEAGDNECERLFEQLKRDDEHHVEQLRGELERMVREGKFH